MFNKRREDRLAVPPEVLRKALDRMVLDSLPPVLSGLAVLYGVFTVGHAFLLPAGPREVMLAVAGASAAAFAVLRWRCAGHPPAVRRAHPLGAGIALVVLLNCQLHRL